jgi:N-acetylmuramoyl-L-alanine amidase
MKRLLVILDNGHGDDTSGKRSPVWKNGSQLFEYEFNREIVNLIALELTAYENHGIDCTRLVPELHDVSLRQRVVRTNNIVKAARAQGDETLLISVHGNAGKGTGWEVFTTVGETKSDLFAESIALTAISRFAGRFPVRKDVSDGDLDKESNFYILKNSIGPAVLTENLFMDTWKDCKFMMSSEGKRVLAKIHIEAILDYFKSLNK